MTDATDAGVRCRNDNGMAWLACLDVAALLLDAAATADEHPELSAGAALRGLAAGLANYQPPTEETP